MSEHIEPNGETAIAPATTIGKRTRRRRNATPLDVEAKAIGETYGALKPLESDPAAIDRVIDYVRQRFKSQG